MTASMLTVKTRKRETPKNPLRTPERGKAGAQPSAHRLSERIADGKMQSLSILETPDVVESALARVVRNMQTDAPVEPDDEEVQVVAQPDTSSHSKVFERAPEFEIRIIKLFIDFLVAEIAVNIPDIAHVQEDGTFQITRQTCPIFKITLQLHVTILHQIRVLSVFIAGENARSEASDGESTDAVGSAHVETLAERRRRTVSVTVDQARTGMGHQLRRIAQAPPFGEICFHLDELRERILEQRLVLFVPFFASRHVGQGRQVPRFRECQFP